MKFIITSVILVAFTVSSCKKDTFSNASNDTDSISAYDNNTIPTDNFANVNRQFG